MMLENMSTKRDPNRLRVLRAERRMTQLTLARKARINVTRISFIENSLVEPTDVEQKRLARALKADVQDVFPVPEAVAS